MNNRLLQVRREILLIFEMAYNADFVEAEFERGAEESGKQFADGLIRDLGTDASAAIDIFRGLELYPLGPEVDFYWRVDEASNYPWSGESRDLEWFRLLCSSVADRLDDRFANGGVAPA